MKRLDYSGLGLFRHKRGNFNLTFVKKHFVMNSIKTPVLRFCRQFQPKVSVTTSMFKRGLASWPKDDSIQHKEKENVSRLEEDDAMNLPIV